MRYTRFLRYNKIENKRLEIYREGEEYVTRETVHELMSFQFAKRPR